MSLTARELEIAQLIAQGKTNREIGEFLEISIHTVDNHRAAIYRKLDVHNAVELTHRLYMSGNLEMKRPRGRPKRITG